MNELEMGKLVIVLLITYAIVEWLEKPYEAKIEHQYTLKEVSELVKERFK